MINPKQIIVFGYGPYGEELAKSLRTVHGDIILVEQKHKYLQMAEQAGFTQIHQIDIHDDLAFKQLNIQEDAIVFCAFDDESFNTFLTLSLRSQYENLRIVALGETQESTHKLMMVGANKVIIIEETGANIIYNMLMHPYVASLIEQLLYFRDDLQVSEITISEQSPFQGQKLKSITLNETENLITLGIVKHNGNGEFVFASSGRNYQIEAGDTLVVMGSTEDIIQASKLHA